MAMQHISKALAGVMADIEAKRAANGPHEFGPSHNRAKRKAGSGAQSNREDDSAHLLTGETSREHGNGVSRSSGDQTETGTHVRGSKADKRSNAGDTVILTRDPLVDVADRALMRPALTVARNMRVTSPDGLPHPVARIFLVTIDGVRVHAGSVSL